MRVIRPPGTKHLKNFWNVIPHHLENGKEFNAMSDTENNAARLTGAALAQARARDEVARLKAGGHAGPERNRMVMTPPSPPTHPAGTIVIRGSASPVTTDKTG
jgi:hypothetical protein